MKHKHWKEMAEYAKDAMETDRPWDRWEHNPPDFLHWHSCIDHPSWSEHSKYRRKPRTININGFEVPEPVRVDLEDEQDYFLPDLSATLRTAQSRWGGDEMDAGWLKRGLIHLTREAAEAHARALLSFTSQEEKQ